MRSTRSTNEPSDTAPEEAESGRSGAVAPRAQESESFVERLARRLQNPLPFRAAQRFFEPELSYGRHFGPRAHDARPAAVAILLYRRESAWWLPLTVRTATLRAHAFPQASEAFIRAAIEMSESLSSDLFSRGVAHPISANCIQTSVCEKRES